MRFLAIVLCTGSLLTALLDAHHSATPVYNVETTISISGVVRSFRFVNPHSMMMLEVKDPSGKVVLWTVEFPGVLNLSEAGWTAKSVAVGESVTVTGNPTHSASPRIFFRRIQKADGTQLFSTAS